MIQTTIEENSWLGVRGSVWETIDHSDSSRSCSATSLCSFRSKTLL